MPSSSAAPMRMRLPRWWLLDVRALGQPLAFTLVDAYVRTMLGAP